MRFMMSEKGHMVFICIFYDAMKIQSKNY